MEVKNNSLLLILVLPSSSRPLICSSFSLMISIVSLELSLVESSSRKPFISCSIEKWDLWHRHFGQIWDFNIKVDKYGLVVKEKKALWSLICKLPSSLCLFLCRPAEPSSLHLLCAGWTHPLGTGQWSSPPSGLPLHWRMNRLISARAHCQNIFSLKAKAQVDYFKHSTIRGS